MLPVVYDRLTEGELALRRVLAANVLQGQDHHSHGVVEGEGVVIVDGEPEAGACEVLRGGGLERQQDLPLPGWVEVLADDFGLSPLEVKKGHLGRVHFEGHVRVRFCLAHLRRMRERETCETRERARRSVELVTSYDDPPYSSQDADPSSLSPSHSP